MKIEFDTIEELKEMIAFFGCLCLDESAEKKTKTRSEINRQNYLNRKVKQSEKSEKSENSDLKSENSDLDREERENEKEEERKERTKEKKEEERVKEKEEINIYIADQIKTQSAGKPKAVKKAYGSGQNVMLTDEEYRKLKEQFADADQKIENMSLYFSSKGNAGKYKSHYATALNWARMAAERDAAKVPKEIPKEKSFRDLRIEMENQAKAKEDVIDSFWRV